MNEFFYNYHIDFLEFLSQKRKENNSELSDRKRATFIIHFSNPD